MTRVKKKNMKNVCQSRPDGLYFTLRSVFFFNASQRAYAKEKFWKGYWCSMYKNFLAFCNSFLYISNRKFLRQVLIDMSRGVQIDTYTSNTPFQVRCNLTSQLLCGPFNFNARCLVHFFFCGECNTKLFVVLGLGENEWIHRCIKCKNNTRTAGPLINN